MDMHTEENEISLIDLLVVVAENLRLLLLGPLVAAAIALGISFAMPSSYTSQAILSLPTSTSTSTSTQAATALVSPLVLDAVVASLNLAAGAPADAARQRLASQIKVSVGKDGTVHLGVTWLQAAKAQAIANATLDAWFNSTVPVGIDRADLEKRLGLATTSLASVNRTLDRLVADAATSDKKPLMADGADARMVALGELQARYLADVISIPRALAGLPRTVVVQPPTLPTDPASPKRSLIALLAALGSGCALLLWVFMRQAWRNAALDPRAAAKQSRLRSALGLKVRP